MSWSEQRGIRSRHSHTGAWIEFVGLEQEFGLLTDVFAFRGQANEKWSLVPALLRGRRRYGRNRLLKIEAAMLDSFKSRAWSAKPREPLPPDEDILSWWTLMQHYGAPTRLLDWTESLYVACYFAVRDEPNKPGAIWYFNDTRLRDELRLAELYPPEEDQLNHFTEATRESELIYPYRPNHPTDRVFAQEGRLTVARDIVADPAKLISDPLPAGRVDNLPHCGRIIIWPEFKLYFLHSLYRMRIEASTLFPGLDGVGQTMREFLDRFA